MFLVIISDKINVMITVQDKKKNGSCCMDLPRRWYGQTVSNSPVKCEGKVVTRSSRMLNNVIIITKLVEGEEHRSQQILKSNGSFCRGTRFFYGWHNWQRDPKSFDFSMTSTLVCKSQDQEDVVIIVKNINPL